MVDFANVLVSVPGIMAGTQWAKSVFKLTGRQSQAIAIVVGVLFSLLHGLTTYAGMTLGWQPILRWLAEGIMYGLAASGFYDVTLNTPKKERSNG